MSYTVICISRKMIYMIIKTYQTVQMIFIDAHGDKPWHIFLLKYFCIFDKWVHSRARNFRNVHQIIKLSSMQVKFPLEIWLCQCSLKPLLRDSLCQMLICFITSRMKTQLNADYFFFKYPLELTLQLTNIFSQFQSNFFIGTIACFTHLYIIHSSTNCDVIWLLYILV